MNSNSRTIKIIETSLARLEAAVAMPAAGQVETIAMDALGVLDEIRRLERKWVEQVATGSPRRKPTDFAAMEGWCRRWLLATRGLALLPPAVAPLLARQREAVERELAAGRFRAAASAMRST